MLIVQLGADLAWRGPGGRGHDCAAPNNAADEPDQDSFGIDADGNLFVTYTVNREDLPPFSIGIYGSPDGAAARCCKPGDVTDPVCLAAAVDLYP